MNGKNGMMMNKVPYKGPYLIKDVHNHNLTTIWNPQMHAPLRHYVNSSRFTVKTKWDTHVYEVNDNNECLISAEFNMFDFGTPEYEKRENQINMIERHVADNIYMPPPKKEDYDWHLKAEEE